MATTAHLHVEYPIEVFDEDAGEVLIFDTEELYAAFEDAELNNTDFDMSLIHTRAVTLREQMLQFVNDLDRFVAQAA